MEGNFDTTHDALPAFDITAHQLRILHTLLDGVRRSISREELVNELLSTLSHNHVARNFILVEGYVSSRGLETAHIKRVVGSGSDQRWRLLQKGFSRRWRNSELMRTVLVENSEVEFLHTQFSYSEYKNEFHELHGDRPMWLCAVPLPASRAAMPTRGLFALYDVIGHQYEKDSLPAGAEKEWSLLKNLPTIHGMLDYQLGNVADSVALRRREIIMELAPRAITHEIGTSLGIIQNTLGRLGGPLQRLNSRLQNDKDFRLLLEDLLFVRQLVDEAERVTQAFTNIEKRKPDERISLRQIVEEVHAILNPLLKRQRIELHVEEKEKVIVHTDAALVQHVILNVMINAIEAVEQERHARQQNERCSYNIYVVLQQNPNEQAEILIANDGPPIPVHLGERIFEKGVTTRPHGRGHGQGLYLCRLIARYLEGEFGFCPPGSNTLRNVNVCFRLVFPLHKQYHEDLQAGSRLSE